MRRLLRLVLLERLHELGERRPHREHVTHAQLFQRLDVTRGNDTPDDHRDVAGVLRPQPLDNPAGQQQMRAREYREADDVDVLLDRLADDLFRRPLEPGVNDLEAGVAQRVRHHFGAAVVAVEPRLRNQDSCPTRAAAHAGRNAGSQRALPLGSSATLSGERRTVWPIATFAGSVSTRIENTRRPSIFTIAKTRGPAKPTGNPTSWIVNAWIVPSPHRSTH